MSAFVDKVDAARPKCDLFELRRSVPLDLFHQGGPDALDQPNASRGHGHEQLGRLNSASDKCGRYPITEPTVGKSQVPIRFVCSRPHVSFFTVS